MTTGSGPTGGNSTMPVQDDRKKPYIWTFVSGTLVAYRFSMTRSGDTPKAILGGTTGTLVVDMYTGYNAITGVDGRQLLAGIRKRGYSVKFTGENRA